MSNVFAGKKVAKDTIDEDYVPSGGVFDTDIVSAFHTSECNYFIQIQQCFPCFLMCCVPP